MIASNKINILVVDDEESIRSIFYKALLRKGYNVRTAESGKECTALLGKQKYHIVFLDLNMPGQNGLEVLKIIKSIYPEIEVIIITGHGTMRMGQESLQLGAYDYLTKPVDINDLLNITENVIKHIKLNFDKKPIRANIFSQHKLFEIQGESPAIKSILGIVRKLAPTSSNVLIQGETGTGKEIVARHIHNKSQRRNERFIVINCAALPDNLLESELFGYEAGAFTDASKQKRGLLEVANKGTLFLDEVAELSLALQAKLLRVVETGEFRRLGSNKDIRVDVRILSATNKDLGKEISSHGFRRDLFYRLGVISFNIPPLRERAEDIPLLVKYFLKFINVQEKKEKKISKEAVEKLGKYYWPGNIRELRNVIERMVILTDKDCVDVADLPNFIHEGENLFIPEYTPLAHTEHINEYNCQTQGESSIKEEVHATLGEREKIHIKKILEETGGNRTKSAKILGISRYTLIKKIKRYRMK